MENMTESEQLNDYNRVCVEDKAQAWLGAIRYDKGTKDLTRGRSRIGLAHQGLNKGKGEEWVVKDYMASERTLERLRDWRSQYG